MNDERKRQAEKFAEKAAKENTKKHWNGQYPEEVISAEADLEFWRGYKQGWSDADTTPAPSEQGDEEAANARWKEYPNGVDGMIAKSEFKLGLAHARRTQAERMIRLQNANDGLKKVVSHYFAEIERLKKELEWHRTQHGKDLVKTVGDVHGVLVSENQELRSLLERAKGFADFVFGYNTTNGINPKYELEWLSDYAKLTSNAAQGGDGEV